MKFVDHLSGTLIRLEEDEHARFKFEVWFDYTRQAMNQIREGAMLAVPNFASSSQEQHLSILEVVTVLPVHYALGDPRDTTGFPGFVEQAARNIVADWEEQETESTQDTTKIRCVAIPTNWELVQSLTSGGDGDVLQEESNLPMVGGTVNVLDTESTKKVVNYGIDPNRDNVLTAGHLIRDVNVPIYVRIEDLLKTHFGIFGFTGAGKSNLTSSLLSRVLLNTREPVKVLFFDLMGDYTTLMVDQLLRDDLDAFVVALGERTLPGPVMDYVSTQGASDDALDRAAESLTRYTLMPKALFPQRGALKAALRRLLVRRKVRVFSDVQNLTLYYLFFDDANPRSVTRTKDRRGAKRDQRYKEINEFMRKHGSGSKKIDATLASKLKFELEAAIGGTLKEWSDDLRGVIEYLEEAVPALQHGLACGISLDELVYLANERSKSSVLIFTAADPNVLRSFANRLGNYLFENRRRSGEIEPMVSFIFDEADEFIPQNAQGSYKDSSEIAMTLARRGRKFGLGIGIATQRVRYLDTSIMAQPHTYFVSKMPRATDRTVVAEAFGVNEEMYRQTFKFKKGDWLLMSYDATGIEAMPIPIHARDANQRVRVVLENLEGLHGDITGKRLVEVMKSKKSAGDA